MTSTNPKLRLALAENTIDSPAHLAFDRSVHRYAELFLQCVAASHEHLDRPPIAGQAGPAARRAATNLARGRRSPTFRRRSPSQKAPRASPTIASQRTRRS